MRRRSSDRPILLWLAGALALASLSLACGSDETASSPEPAAGEPAASEPAPASPAPTEPAPGTAAAPDAAAAASGEGVATDGVIPSGFPSDVPIYPGAEPGPGMSMPGLGVFATFEVDDSPEQILGRWTWRLARSVRKTLDRKASQEFPEAKRLLGAVANSRGHRHEDNVAQLVRIAAVLPLPVGAALLASAEGYTPRANAALDRAREELGPIQEIAAALAESLPAPKAPARKSRRRRRKRRPADAGQAAAETAGQAASENAAAEPANGSAETPAPAADAATEAAAEPDRAA